MAQIQDNPLRAKQSMYAFWHAVFAGTAALLACKVVKPNPAKPFLLAATFFGVVPDVDHLLCWRPDFLLRLIPRHPTEGLDFTLRARVYPCYLHLWLWPIALIALASLARNHKHWKYILAAAIGWAVHLALDGVIVLI